MTDRRVVTPEQWLESRKALLDREKELTRKRDELAQARRDLPWVRVDKRYVFEGPDGKQTLSELFGDKQQLIIYHFMFGPGWGEGCPSCSMALDQVAAAVVHLAARNVAFAAVSRAPYSEIAPFQRRMGWQVRWVSSHESDFNHDYHVSFSSAEVTTGQTFYNFGINQFPVEEAPGLSIFFKDDDGTVFHTYSSYARGAEPLLAAYTLLDMVPNGRDESTLPHPMAWIRHHDKYDLTPV